MSLKSDHIVGVIESLGGTIVPGPTLRFNLPLAEIRETVPKINALGLRCKRISEHATDDHRGTHSVVTLELFRSS